MNKEDRFNKVILENSGRIQRICNYYSQNSEDRKDIYQDILVNIWKSLDNFKGNSALSTWVYRVAINTSLSYTGKAFKQMKLIIDKNTQNLNSLLSNEDLDKKYEQEEIFDKLHTELNLLSVIDKALITLVLEGLSMREISDIIGITESNAKVKIHRIKTNLKSNLTEKRNGKNYGLEK